MAAKNIALLGAIYPAVPAVQLPISGGGTAKFTEVSDTTATAADVAEGKTFYLATGEQATGTASGGGGGGGHVKNPAVIFMDYDGTIVAEYDLTAAQALTALPANPSHDGLTAQGWNWTLAQIKAQLTAYPKSIVYVGQMYITSSGATEIDIVLYDGRLSPYLTLAVNGSVSVDWGDNSTSTVTGSSLTTQVLTQHSYASAGAYTISISRVSGSYSLYVGDASNYLILTDNKTANYRRAYTNSIHHVRIGSNCSLSSYAFRFAYSLKTITMPSTITGISTSTFTNAFSLLALVLPSGLTTIPNNLCYSSYGLQKVSVPYGVTSIGDKAFQSCYALEWVTVPDGVTSIGEYAFDGCYALRKLSIPDSVTSLGAYVCQNCTALEGIDLPGVSVGSYAFSAAYTMAYLSIAEGATSIGTYAFANTRNLISVTIPSTVTSIGTYAFSNCYGVKEYHFLRSTPPTLSATNAFSNLAPDVVFYVPQGSLNAYKTKSNWSTYASYMQEEPT